MLIHTIYMDYVLNSELLKRAARERGYGGLAGVLRALGLHRNTLTRYMDGAPVVPKSLAAIIGTLGLDISAAIVPAVGEKGIVSHEPVLPLVSILSEKFPSYSYVLFGSRVKGKARQYSDFDLGVLAPQGLPLKEYLKMIELKEDFEDNSSIMVDLVDLSRAAPDFIRGISPDALLLAGRYADLVSLQKVKANGRG